MLLLLLNPELTAPLVPLAVPAATATVAAVAPALRTSYAVPAASATAASTAPACRVSFTIPVATATVAAVAPALRGRATVPAATATVTSVAPTVRVSFSVPAATVTGSATAAFAVTFAVPTMTTEDTAFPPALDITYTVPAMAATAEMSVPVFTQTGDVIAPPRVRGVGNGVVQVWELEEILRSEYTYLVPAMQARATMGKPRLIVSEIPMDEDLSLLLELELV